MTPTAREPRNVHTANCAIWTTTSGACTCGAR